MSSNSLWDGGLLYAGRLTLTQLRTVFQLCACHPYTSNMTVTERFATSRYYCLMPVHARLGLTLTSKADIYFGALQYY